MTKKKASVPYDETRNTMLKDQEVAAMYLEECLADGDIGLFKEAIKHVAKARLGGMTALSKESGFNRAALYSSFSKSGNPRIDTLTKVLHATGLRLSITPEIGA